VQEGAGRVAQHSHAAGRLDVEGVGQDLAAELAHARRERVDVLDRDV
jgi:hypothetical protein